MTDRRDSREALADVARRFGLADVYVFGSRSGEFVGGTTRGTGDVDVAVRPAGAQALPPEARVDLTVALEHALGASPVDLLILPEAGPFLALAAIRGNLLYCADGRDQAEYELFVLRRAGDLEPLERERREIVFGGGR